MLLVLQLGSSKGLSMEEVPLVEQHIMAKASTSSGLTACSHFALLFPHISCLMFFQSSVFGPKPIDDPIDSTFPLKEADSVCVMLFFRFTERLLPTSLAIADNVCLYEHIILKI